MFFTFGKPCQKDFRRKFTQAERDRLRLFIRKNEQNLYTVKIKMTCARSICKLNKNY